MYKSKSNIIECVLFFITDKPMNMQATKMTSKLGLQKPKSILNTTANKEKKVNPQATLNSSLQQIKKKRQQPTLPSSQSNIEKEQVQVNTYSKNIQQIKATTIPLSKDTTVNTEEEGSKKIKTIDEKAKIITSKIKNVQPSKPNTNPRESVKLNRPKIDEKVKQFSIKKGSHCSLRNGVFSVQLNGDIKKTQSNQQTKLQYQEMVKKLNETMQENKQLKAKLDKLKASNQQYRKSLKDQVATFNMQGQQAKKTKETLELLQMHNARLIEELTEMTKENATSLARMEQITNEKKEIEVQIQLQHKNLCQMKQIYMGLKEKYEEQVKRLEEKQQQINQLAAVNSEVMSLQLESKLNRSSACLDQVTDLSINSQIKDEQPHFKPILVQTQPINPDLLQISRRLEEKYLGLINELKNRLLECQMQNFQLEAEIQQLQHSRQNYDSAKLDLNTQTEKLLLLMQNNGLKVNQYEIKQEIKQLNEKLKLEQLQKKQMIVEKEVKEEQLAALQIQLAKMHQDDQLIKQQHQLFKHQLQQSQQIVRKFRLQWQQDAAAKVSTVKKVKYFK